MVEHMTPDTRQFISYTGIFTAQGRRTLPARQGLTEAALRSRVRPEGLVVGRLYSMKGEVTRGDPWFLQEDGIGLFE